MKEIVIDIDKSGRVKIEGFGFTGTECKDLTASIERALGDVEKTTMKPEYNATATRDRTVRR